MFTLFEGVDDQDEIDEGEEDYIEFFESGEDAAEAFQPAERSLHFVTLLIEFSVISPWIEPVGFGRDHWNHTQIKYQLPRFVAFVGFVHP